MKQLRHSVEENLKKNYNEEQAATRFEPSTCRIVSKRGSHLAAGLLDLDCHMWFMVSWGDSFNLVLDVEKIN
jgi:hypothetical protein